jgi:uncharacterized protein (AIM24 family)
MKLLLAILGVLARKAVMVTLLAVALVLTAFVWNWAREQTQLARRIEEARARVNSSWQDWRSRKAESLDLEARLLRLQAGEPPWYNPVDRLQWRARVAAAEAAVEAARAARDQAHAAWQEAAGELSRVEQRVDKTWTGLLAAARRTGWQLLAIIVLVLAGPLVWKAVWYYGLATLASHRPPAQILPADAPGRLSAGAAGKNVEVPVTPNRPLVARMDWVQQYSPALSKRTRFLFEWRSPFTSFAAGLAEMTELTVRAPAASGTVGLAAGDDPNAYLLALKLEQHPGVVLKPGAVVAVAGTISLRPRWRLNSLHHWIAGRVRHILFCGTGTVYVTGTGGVEVCAAEHSVVVEEALVLGYDSRAAFATVRTETFWPYFRGKTSLFDYRFEGGHLAIRQTSAPAAARRGNPFVRTVDALLNGIGKLLGF